jgi:hypothetical protein
MTMKPGNSTGYSDARFLINRPIKELNEITDIVSVVEISV